MVPSEYRLEHVAAGLIERLDASRRSYDDPGLAREGFERAAVTHVDAAIAEWRALSFTSDPEPHAAFLRRELLETVLPRVHKAAMGMNEAEARGFGAGWWATPVGRVALVAVAVLIFWFVLVRFIYLPFEWPLILANLGLPFVPDVLAALQHRRYRAELLEIVGDMSRIQNQQLAYQPDQLAPVHNGAPVAPRQRPPERDRA
jgi:hypothetical protein